MAVKTMSVRRWGLSCACGVTALMAGQAHAQTSAPATGGPPPAGTALPIEGAKPTSASTANSPSTDNDGRLEEVVVTARKQVEKLQDVPVTVTALTSKAIEKLEIKNIFDLATVTPGLYFGTTGGRNGGNKLQIRNFSTGTAGPSKASVFIDGQYIPGDYSSIPLANLERIEVLKGPQSAYFGRATFVGAVNFITRDPTNDFNGTIDAVGATEGEYDITGYVSIPIIKDKLSTQITFRDYSFDGPSKWRTNDGLHLGGQGTKAISSKTVLKVNDDLTLKFNYSHVEDDDEIPPVLYGDPTQRVPIARPGGTFGYYYTGAVHYNFSQPSWGLPTTMLTNPGIRHEQDRYSVGYDWKAFGQTISGYLSYAHEKYNEQLDGNYYLSGTSPFVVPNALGVPTTSAFASSFFNYNLKEKDTQFEIRVSSPTTWRLRYTAGYSYVKVDGSAQLAFLNNQELFSSNGYGGSFLNPATDNSLFGGLYLDITDQLTLSVEGRYQNETITSKTFGFAANNYGQTLTSATADYETFLPRVNLQYRFTPNIQFYVLYAEGNNPGGFQPVTPAQAAANGFAYNYAEETIKNYEGGFKTRLFDGRVVLDVAAYHMTLDNEQLAQTQPVAGTPTGFASIYLPGVSSQVTGFEGELDWAVFRNFQVRGTVGYGKAEYIHFCSAPYAALTGIQTGLNCRAVDGKQQEGTPALQTSLSGDYTHQLANDWALYLRGDWEYQSKVYNEEWDASWVPAHSILNARVGVEHGNYTAEFFVRNLTDDDNSARSTRVTDGRLAAVAGSYPNLGGFSQAIAGEQGIAGTARKPRQFGVRLAARF